MASPLTALMWQMRRWGNPTKKDVAIAGTNANTNTKQHEEILVVFDDVLEIVRGLMKESQRLLAELTTFQKMVVIALVILQHRLQQQQQQVGGASKMGSSKKEKKIEVTMLMLEREFQSLCDRYLPPRSTVPPLALVLPYNCIDVLNTSSSSSSGRGGGGGSGGSGGRGWSSVAGEAFSHSDCLVVLKKVTVDDVIDVFVEGFFAKMLKAGLSLA